MSLAAWVGKARQLGASDLHLEPDMPPVARVRGELRILGEPLPAARVEEVLQGLVSTGARAALAARGSADLSIGVGSVRCRVNLYRTSRGIALAVRLLMPALGGLRAANLHPSLSRLMEPRSGLVLVSGPRGCGKSTTLAALIEEVNASQARHILTLESPLEHVFAHGRSFIRQREIPTHSPSFEQAITDALRENPDILMISEMRTPEVMRLTLDAAETGHLVLASLYSPSCAEALGRICMAFPEEAQGSIRAQLADCLAGVVCQRLDYLEQRQLLVPRCEVLTASDGARSAIRTGQLGQLADLIQGGGEDGMWTFESYQRWMEQKEDWVQPFAPTQVREERATSPPSLQPPSVQPPSVQPLPVQPPSVHPPSVQPASVQLPSLQPPVVQPLPAQPPSAPPPSLQPPSVQAPAVSPPSVQPPSVQPPSAQPPAVQPPAVSPPSVQPPSVQPLSAQPPSVQPPAVSPPSVQPPSVQPLSAQPPSVQPPAVKPPSVQPPKVRPRPTEDTRAASRLTTPPVLSPRQAQKGRNIEITLDLDQEIDLPVLKPPEPPKT